MKATEQYFPVVLFIMLCKVVPNFLSLWMKFQSVTTSLCGNLSMWFPVVSLVSMTQLSWAVRFGD